VNDSTLARRPAALRQESDERMVVGDRELVDRAFSRAAGAERVAGNSVRLLRDAAENYPAWLAAIRGAERYVYFESYILAEDRAGTEFADALAETAAGGVAVRLVYDWLGSVTKTSRSFWQRLRSAGVDVRGFNPPRLASPLGWLHRDHRKMLAVDGRVGFVSGLCIGDEWVGDRARGLEPWRDTGLEVRGPAVADVEAAFARVWSACGAPLPGAERVPRAAMGRAGDVTLRIVAGEPWTAEMLRVDQLVAAAAGERLWLSDAYFAGSPSYVQALRAAALDGVDVRLLVPGGSDIPLLRPLSRAGYRPLLEAGVRVFEWNGPMLHAKTAVADGRWARVGSTNLNVASWLGNYELDVVVEDAGFAEAMEAMYDADLAHATEVVLTTTTRRSRRPRTARMVRTPRDAARAGRRGAGSTGRAAAGAVRLGNAVGAAITGRRELGQAEAPVITGAALAVVGIAVVALLWPRAITLPLAAVLLWLGAALLNRRWALARARRRPDRRSEAQDEPPAGQVDDAAAAGRALRAPGRTASDARASPGADRGNDHVETSEPPAA
jgi:cardiolipin synthase